MNINKPLPGGNVQSRAPLVNIKNFALCDLSVSWSSLSDLKNLATWKAKIQTALTVHAFRAISGYENTTDDPNIQTLNSGRKYPTSKPAPSITLMLDSNYEDFVEVMNSVRGGSYGIVYFDDMGRVQVKRKGDGTYVPLPINAYAMSKHIPIPGENGSMFKMYVSHFDYDDFLNCELVDPGFSFEELTLAMPVGLKMIATSTMATGSIHVQITERCGDGYEGLLNTDFEVVNSNNLTSPAVTVASDDDDGNYELTIQKSVSPENLDAGDFVDIIVNKGGGSLTTHISNVLRVHGTGA